eukprot:scaffold330_cov246-Pinguiococcus_pyrenoidosus.AAC.5
MGRLSSIEVENFKSYGGTQVIGPFSDVTCVIGPNGSGKSNLMEAISFAVGTSARKLRSDKLKNVIFHGEEDAMPKRAMVKLVYRLDEDESEEQEEVHFSRSITASGKSTYQVDGKTVSFEEYERQLGSIGVLTDARNFLIFQGDVESIAQMSPTDLSKLIENVSGSGEYKERYDELKVEKEQALRTKTLALQKRKGCMAEKKQVREQKEEAERFEAIQKEVSELRTLANVHRLYHNYRDSEDAKASRTAHEKEKGEVEGSLEVLDGKLQETKKSQAKLQQKVESCERQVRRKTDKLKKFAPRGIRITEQLKKLRKSLKNADVAINRIKRDSEAQEARVADLEEQKAKLEQDARQLEAEISELQDGGPSELSPEQREQFLQLRQKAQGVCLGERQALETLRRQRTVEAEFVQETETELKTASQRIKDMNEELTKCEAREAELDDALQSAEAETASLRKQIADRESTAHRDAQRVDELERELGGVNEQLKSRREVRRQGRKQRRMAECIETLIGLFPGVYGRLVDVCKPRQRKYHKAIAVAAGKIMDHIVVDTAKTGVACIEYMRQQRVGTASFIPLDTIKTESVKERLRSLGDDFKLCVDVISCEEDVRKAVMYAVGNTVICKNLDKARHLCFQRGEHVRAVTLDGHMISRSGAMTGGSSHVDEARADRWDEQEFLKLQKQRSGLEEQIRQLSNRRAHGQTIEHLRAQLAEATRRIEGVREDKTQLRAKMQQIRHQVEKAGGEKASKEASLARNLDTIQSKDAQIEEIAQTIETAENELYGSLGEDFDATKARARVERSALEKARLEGALEAIQEKTIQVDTDIDYEKSRDFRKPLTKVQNQKRAAEKEIRSLEDEMSQIEDERRASAEAIEDYTRQADEQKKLLMEAKVEAEGLRRERSDLLAQHKTIQRKISSCDTDCQRLKDKRDEILREAEVNQIQIPFVDDDGESQRQSSASSDLTGAAREVDFSALPDEEYEDASKFSKLQQKIDQQITSKTTAAEQLQPNMRAVQRFDEVNERLRGTNEEFEDAKEKARATSDEFEEVRRSRHDMFMECYNNVHDALTKTYRDLTKSSKHPLGGNAYLMLENVDEPYLGGIKYNAMPPMKRFRDMEQLSGGEKTVAALALLFAIHGFRPAPFFVMDEIDAALDNVNVKKVCNFVTGRRSSFQSIIITHKDQFFRHADTLCGIARDEESGSSVSYSIDLREYAE